MNFIRAVQVLVDAGVEFVIIGGWSAILHGSSYVTRDLDVCFSRSRENLKRLAAALAPFHPRLRDLSADLPFVWDDATLRNGSVFTLVTDLGIIDLLAEVAAVGGYGDALANSVLVHSFERDVRTLDLAALFALSAPRAAVRTLVSFRSWSPCSRPPSEPDHSLRYSALKKNLYAACDCPRHCGRKPSSTTRPFPTSADNAATRPCSRSAPTR
jgi:hypothetical protein